MTEAGDTNEPGGDEPTDGGESPEDTGGDGGPQSATRRNVIIGGAVGAGAVLVAGGVYAAIKAGEDETTDRVVAARIGDKVPVDDPESSLWGDAEKARIELDSQVLVPPTRPEPFRDIISVRALHDGDTIGFRLEWKDQDTDDLTIGVDSFRDACAVLLASATSDQAVRIMGTAETPATILHWKADWQRDVDEGFQDLEVEFPNGSFDFYPPLQKVEMPVSPQDYVEEDATQWLPGMDVANVLSEPVKSTPVEKTLGKGFGTLTTLPTQDAAGSSSRSGDTWKAVLAKPLSASDDDEVALEPGAEYSMAVAIWAGQEGDVGGHKSPSKLLLTLQLEA